MAWSHLSLGLVSFNAVQFAKLNMVHLPCTSPSMPTLLCNAALISVPPDFSSPTSPTSPAHQNETLRASGFREVENVFISLYFEFCRRTSWMHPVGRIKRGKEIFVPSQIWRRSCGSSAVSYFFPCRSTECRVSTQDFMSEMEIQWKTCSGVSGVRLLVLQRVLPFPVGKTTL